MTDPTTTWHKALDPDDLPEGRVTTVTIGTHTLCLTHHQGQFGALDNHCPHQGGPLGEGAIEPGKPGPDGEPTWVLRCPWHGYDYDPLTGSPPPPFDDEPSNFPTEVRDDGVYVELPDPAPRERTVSDVIVGTLRNWGLTTVFGMVGHSNLGFADAMREAEESGGFRFIGIRHEGAAAFAASAFGKLTGGLAGCFGIAGPGSTNMLTGLYDAKVDGAPILALTGQVPSKAKGRGAFQDLDLVAAFSDVATFNQAMHAGSDHAELASLAAKSAIVGRSVSHLTLPDEVQPMPSDAPVGGPDGRTGSRAIRPPADVLDEAVSAIGDAARPLVVVGAGARAEMDRVITFAESIGAPVATTFKAKGQISDRHPLGCGVLGRSGTPVASWFMNESDLIIAIGVSFSNHTGISSYKPIVQIDDDPMALGRFHPVTVPVHGNAGVTCDLLAEALADRPRRQLEAEVASRWEVWRAEKASRLADEGSGLNAVSVFESLAEHAPADAVLCIDVGNNAYSFGRYFEVGGAQDVLMSGYLGSIGFALPAAMGSWAAVGDPTLVPEGKRRKVISISGDGGLGQYAMELSTLSKYDMDITHVVLTNGELGKISKEQRSGDFAVWQTSLVNPDFAAFAESCGISGTRVTEPSQLDAALSAAIALDGPALVEICTDALLV